MQSTDREEFKKTIDMLFAAYSRKADDIIKASWWLSLKDCYLSDIQQACDAVTKSSKTLPTPAHIVDFMRGNRKPVSESAPKELPPFYHSNMDLLACGMILNDGEATALKAMAEVCQDAPGLFARLRAEGRGGHTYAEHLESLRQLRSNRGAGPMDRLLPDYEGAVRG